MADPLHVEEQLANLQAGACAVVVALCGSVRRSQRLAELGMTPGVRVEVIRAAPGQPMLLRVRRTLLAIDRGSAADVLVQQVEFGKSKKGRRPGFRRGKGRRFGLKRRVRSADE